MQRKQSPAFCLSGYLDNRAEGFPDIRQTWHGSEGSIYFLISEKGFAKIPTEKKTLYMELNVENKNDEVFSEKGSLQMDLINQWSEAEPMIEGLQKKESFSFQNADYKDENMLEVTFTISNLK